MCRKELILTKSMFHLSVLFDINFRFEPEVCYGCHDSMQRAGNFIDVAIATVKGNDFRIHFLSMSKDEVINLFQNADLTEKRGAL